MAKRHYLLSLICLLFILLLCGCSQKQPTEPDNRHKGILLQRIVFVSLKAHYTPKITVGEIFNDSGTFGLYNVKEFSDGSSPRLSKDQKWIVYISPGNHLTLRRINVDGSNDTEIPITGTNIDVQSVSISPDNSTLAVFAGGFGEGLKLGTIPVKGGVFKAICDQPWSSSDWSTNSQRIYFAWGDAYNRFGHNNPPLGKTYIASIGKNGDDLEFISDTLNGVSNDREPSLSPDGKYIAFTSFRSNPETILPEIFIMGIDGSNVRRLTEDLTSGKVGDHYDYYTMDNEPQWLNDNTHIIFQRVYYKYDYSAHQYKETHDLYIVNKNGNELQNLSNNGVANLYK